MGDRYKKIETIHQFLQTVREIRMLQLEFDKNKNPEYLIRINELNHNIDNYLKINGY